MKYQRCFCMPDGDYIIVTADGCYKVTKLDESEVSLFEQKR